MFEVEKGQTYLLKLINAAVNFHLYVGVAGHNLTIVNADAEYTEPLTREIVVLAPGQTSDVLLTANQAVGQYLLAASVFSPANPSAVPYPTIPTTAIIRYKGASTDLSLTPSLSLPSFHTLHMHYIAIQDNDNNHLTVSVLVVFIHIQLSG